MISSIVKIKQFVSIPTLSSRTNVIRTIVRIKMFLSIPTLFLRTSMILDSKVMIEMKQFVTLFYYSAKPKLKTPCGETLLTKWYWCHFMCRRSRLSLQITQKKKYRQGQKAGIVSVNTTVTSKLIRFKSWNSNQIWVYINGSGSDCVYGKVMSIFMEGLLSLLITYTDNLLTLIENQTNLKRMIQSQIPL